MRSAAIVCGSCDLDMEHCHGTLILHRDSADECSAVGCTFDLDAHDLTITCVEVEAICCRS